VLAKCNAKSVCKLLHFVLAERRVLMVAKDKRILNEVFEALRIMIRPFMWVFSVVFVYSTYFEPLMSSPRPVLIGKVEP
jgi:hypothetical protein